MGDIETPTPSTPEGGDGPATPPAADDKAPRARKSRPTEPEVTQAEPTLPPPTDPATGLELDEHGLPTSGPARAMWLAERGIADPALTDAETETETQND